MSSSIGTLVAAPVLTKPIAGAGQRRHDLHGPLVDFMCLGGVSLLLLPMALLVPNAWAPDVAIAMMLVANLINHPHFALSYQVFYRGFRAKAGSGNPDRALRGRYRLAGIVAPALLGAVLATALAFGNLRLLGLGGNAMAFLVGWHYVKQGYGILMVDAALKRRFLPEREKRVLRLNGYAVWLAGWITVNAAAGKSSLWGVDYVRIAFPISVVWASWLLAGIAGFAALWVLAARRRAGFALPVTGTAAYGITLYLWQLFIAINPVWLLIVPALHSLQYLAVVSRFELNRAKDVPDAMDLAAPGMLHRLLPLRYQQRALGFAVAGIILGFLMFWGVPVLLETVVAYPRETERTMAFLFAAWVFVNVHHYFLDNVMWRSQNPETRKYLFA
jgi:hypothetical protein